MDMDTQEELDLLDMEIEGENQDVSDIPVEDILKNLDELLKQDTAEETVQQPAEEETSPEEIAEEDDYEDYEDCEDDEELPNKKKMDNLTIGLLITASALCLGIIGVMIYWLNNFL